MQHARRGWLSVPQARGAARDGIGD